MGLPQSASTMVFKLCLSAEQHWRRLNGAPYLSDVIDGVKFQDGVKVEQEAA